jgi:hypothetical protein
MLHGLVKKTIILKFKNKIARDKVIAYLESAPKFTKSFAQKSVTWKQTI